MCIESYNTIKGATHSNFKVEIEELNVSVTSYLEPTNDKPISEAEYSERQSNHSNDKIISIEECSFKDENIQVDQDFHFEEDDETDAKEIGRTNFTTDDESDSKDDVWKVSLSTLKMHEQVSNVILYFP